MYQFTNVVLADLTVSQSIAKAGTKHHKQYATAGVSPATQNTLNVYLAGSFNFEAGGYSRVMHAGDTSLDLDITQYPTDVPCVETVLSDWGTRCCISAKKPWVREIINLAPGQVHVMSRDSLVILTGGTANVGGSAMKPVSYREVPKGVAITAGSLPSSLIICRLL